MNINPTASCVTGWTLAAMMGTAFYFTAAPIVPTKDECVTYRVATKAVTAFVLKPPEGEPKACPPAPKCEAPPKVEEPQAEPEKVEDKPRRRRHRRVRRYWR